MEPVSIAIITYVSLKFIDQFLKEEGYGRLRRWLFSHEKYQYQLEKIILETISEHEETYPYNSLLFEGIPFYRSQIVFDYFNKYILFKTPQISYEDLIKKIGKERSIIIPIKEELDHFYKLLVTKINEDKKLKIFFIDENYKSKIFETYDITKNSLEKINLIIAQLIFNPSVNWFKKQCQLSIADLGNRYTPELNFELEISEIFEGLGRTEKFKSEITKKFDKLIIAGKKILKDKDEIKDKVVGLESIFDNLHSLFETTNFLGTSKLKTETFYELLKNAEIIANEIYTYYYDNERKIQIEKKDFRFYHKYGTELRNVEEFRSELDSFIYFINGHTFSLANNPYLVLDGEAGIGKSHLIGDIISNRIRNNFASIFILGQHFVSDEDPWTQIFKKLHINTKTDDFLSKINEFGKKSEKRVVFFIDAINEGRGKYFWNSYIKSFIKELKSYEWIGLVMTIRSSYKDLFFSNEDINILGTIEHTLYGFRNVEYEASKMFFNNYKIELPNVPLLHPEFQNPLFLKLFCEGIRKSGLHRIPDGLQGITSIISFFINGVNNILSQPNRVNYSNSLNLVKKSIDSIIKYKIENQVRYVLYEIAYEIIDSAISKFINKKGFIDELIAEGVLSKNLFWKENNENEEGIYLAYERFEDHLMSLYLLEKFPNVDFEFSEGGYLHDYVKDEHCIHMNRGLIDAFSIQIPEKSGREFFDFIPNFKDNYSIVESFVESLLWRKVDTINDLSKEYVNKYVYSYQGTYDFFWETIIAITAIPGHYFNAYSLHNHLLKFTLADRDAKWTQFLKYKFDNDSAVKRLIDWAWAENDKTHISDESIRLSSITLAWFHTSTNRQLRDSSTKALVSLLQDRINVLIEILELFHNVNDPYVYERLYAVAYGCALRTSQNELLVELSEYIFKTIFKDDFEVYPHILLRDYARGVIEYTFYLNLNLGFEISKVRPPYKSNWPEIIPLQEELTEKYDNEQYYQLWSSIMGFGDFSRYTIGTNHNHSEWSGYKIGETPVDRELVLEKFMSDLNPEQLELFNNLDPIISDDIDDVLELGDIKINYKTAIGRKSEEEIKKINENLKKSFSSEMLSFYEKEVEPYLDDNHNIINTGEHFDLRIAQRFILSKVIELGWNPELHLDFDKEIGTGRGRTTYPHERIGKKYQWIAYYEYLAKLSDNFIKYEGWGPKKENQYQGPWDPYVRDIDPSMLIKKTGSEEDDEVQNFWWTEKHAFNWDCPNEDWINNSSVLPNFNNLIQVKDPSKEEWLVLEGYPSWSEPKKIGEEKWDHPHKEFWCQIRSYLVKDNEFNKFNTWAIKQDFMGRWMPESRNRYEIFSREYYWSPASKYFMTDYYEGLAWRDINDENSGELITEVVVSTESFLWEEEFDKSKEEVISFLKPCTCIYHGMNLKFSRKEGEFLNESEEVVCFAANVYHNSKGYLLIKKAPFLKYLEENNLKIIWTILGEKQILGGRTFGSEYLGRLEVNGVYYFDNEEIKGKIYTKNT